MHNKMADLIPINIVIADRTYRLKVQPSDEEAVRRTVKIINDKIIEFKTQFAGKDLQDYVSMVLLWFATEKSKGTTAIVQQSEAAEQLSQIENLLDKALKS
jgi:cell division protein ZapA (FtsZ GTPase activity inhibitor)